MELGRHYRGLERFAAAELAAAPDAPGGSLCVWPSAACARAAPHARPAARRYRRAVAAGVEELLGEYRGALLRLEQELLTGAKPKLFAFCCSVLWG